MVSNKQQSTDLDLAITGNTPPIESPPRHRAGQKRKNISVTDTTGNSHSSQGVSLRPLAKRPAPDPQQRSRNGQCSSSSIGAAARLGACADTETHQAWPFPPTFTSMGMEPDLGEGSKGSEGLPTGSTPSSSTILMYEDTRAPNGLVGGGEGLLDSNNFDLYAPGGISLVGYPPQGFDFRYAGAQAGLPSEKGVGIPSGEKIGQEWTGSTKSSLATCPWHSHLERIASLVVAISQISRKVKPTTTKPVCETDMATLLQQSEGLYQSYLELRECVEQSMLSSGGDQRSG